MPFRGQWAATAVPRLKRSLTLTLIYMGTYLPYCGQDAPRWHTAWEIGAGAMGGELLEIYSKKQVRPVWQEN